MGALSWVVLVSVLACAAAEEEPRMEQTAAALRQDRPPESAPPSSARGCFRLGHEKMDAGDLDGAAAAFTRARDLLRPSNRTDRAWAMNNVGLCHLIARRPEPARIALEEAVSLDPGNGRAWNNLGAAYLQRLEYGKAEAAFEKALAIQPEWAKPKANLAYATSMRASKAPPPTSGPTPAGRYTAVPR